MAKFNCCGITFDGEQSYLEHRRLVHGEQASVRHTCCGIQFFTDEGYAEHRSKVHGEGQPARVILPDTQRKPASTIHEEPHYLSRCKVCRTPIRGLRSLPYRLRGIIPFTKNPQLCNRCSKASFPAVQQEITVLFADVRGFTSLAEKMPVQELRDSLNLFFDAASKLLIQNDALVDKFIGDAVMALFNAPIPQEKHREAALLTAIALHERVSVLSLPFAIGIGINTGMALTGNVGLGEVTDYTATGDAVNVASRLAALAEKGEILAGLSTCEGRLSVIPAGYSCKIVPLELKGKELAVEAYRLHRQ